MNAINMNACNGMCHSFWPKVTNEFFFGKDQKIGNIYINYWTNTGKMVCTA